MRGWILFVLLTAFLSVGAISSLHNPQTADNPEKPRRAELLFLGHPSEHHNSRLYSPWLATALFNQGINLTYTEKVEDLTPENLNKYDALLIYANHEVLPKAQEDALKGFLAEGKGLIPLHSATGCFKNSDWYIETIGGQFASHGEGEFAATIVNSSHPVMKGITPFTTWDETYVHQRINPDMELLMVREEDGKKEPYTWVRNVGKGRVFYTAFGHDERTWKQQGFLDLMANGVKWAMGEEVIALVKALNIPQVSIYDEPISDFTKRYEVPRIQSALSAEESQKLIQKPVDFEISLFASEPDIQNPIAMAWDERGRLWIVESVDYPNTFKETDGAANDRIKICEDTNGDGRADKFTVFAEGLNIPTSMVFANGGVIVSMAPDFVFLKDTDGDDVADVREVIMTGWGKNDTHAGPSNLKYGFDNKIWGVTGYSGFNGTVNGKRMTFPQGIYRLNPDGSDFEYLASSSNNTWGLGFTEDNNVFISTANNTHAAYFSVPAKHMQRTLPGPKEGEKQPPFQVQPIQKIDGHYDAHSMTPNLRQVDVVGGFTSAAGINFYTARDYPKEYWNRVAFVNEPTIRLTHNAIIEPLGAGFQEKDGWNLLASSDEWFGPVHAEVGPDGAVWIADWYNFIIQHNVFVERQAPSRMVLPFEDQPHGQGNAFHSELRDTNHGRIYRVVYKGAADTKPMSLSKSDTQGLLAALSHTNLFWRMTAQRLLVESKDKSVAVDLIRLVNDRNVDEIGLNGPALHAIWTLHGLGFLDGSHAEASKAVTAALTHPAAGVRKAAMAALPRTQATLSTFESAGVFRDSDLNVRMHAFLELAELPSTPSVGRLLLQAAQDDTHAQDDWLVRALFAAASAHGASFSEAAHGKAISGLAARLLAGVEAERYELGRRSYLNHSPAVSGKEIRVGATVSGRRDEKISGVIVAHGDGQNGYALYVQDDTLVWEISQDGKQTKVTSGSKVLPSSFVVNATLDAKGRAALYMDNQLLGESTGLRLFSQDLHPSVRSGRDLGGQDNIGPYEKDFPFEGNLQQLTLELN
ncbi:MAG: ThuA domain-containing protein [Lunatimonas sp.]|uniref:PVC-type heme-binding CxxCH protein n=1 Tax=Lunatimonas sp. TaxID=2060141 RepID=UPI00263BAC23|nr:PVC-type heme-binding CxxCH protein [Lunatimonas sp.]MCC5938025.1 ThuA domain-containing protein [Lunatimonas sp.]